MSVAIPRRVGSKKDQHNPKLEETLLPAQADNVLEVDEMWSFVQEHWQKRWIWTAMCRRTRQIITYVIGDRSQKTCQRLWERIPASYKECQSFSDLWEAYLFVRKTLSFSKSDSMHEIVTCSFIVQHNLSLTD